MSFAIPSLFAAAEPASLKLYLGVLPVEAVDLYPVLETVTVTVSRKEPGVATIVLSAMRDETGAWPVLDGGYFSRWKPVRVVADFGLYGEDVLWGYVLKVTPEFPADRGAAKVTVEIQDETIALDRQSQRQSWNTPDVTPTLSDGAIVSNIVAGHRLKPAAGNGAGLSQGTLTQDKTDFRFISELAEAVGYEFRVQFGEAYFGPMTLTGDTQEALLVYAGPDTSVMEFSIEEEAALPVEARMATVGEGGGEEITVPPDLPVLGMQAAYDEGGAGLDAFLWDVRQEGDADATAAEMLTQSKVNAASLSIKAEALVDSTQYGHVIQPGRLIEVDGIGHRYGGRFYVDTVEHVFDSAGYVQKAVLLKNGIFEGG